MNEGDITKDTIDLFHHHQSEFCRTRPAYRQGRELTAVKAYTINSESTHLLIFGVPKINLRPELKNLVQRYGKLKCLTISPNYPSEEFTECYHVNFENLQSARKAKKSVDMKNFYGSVLHVCYAPELETCQETRQKLSQRKTFIWKRLVKLKKDETVNSNNFNQMNEIPHVPKSLLSFQNNLIPLHNTLISLGNTIHPLISQSEYLNTPSDSQNLFFSKNEDKINENTTNESFNNIKHSETRDFTFSSCNMESNLKRPNDLKDHVFKKKKRKHNRNKNVSCSISKNSNVQNNTANSQKNDSNESGKVLVFETDEKPQIKHIPKKVTNKIIMKINTKLI